MADSGGQNIQASSKANVVPKGTLVTLKGLQSAAGKKLNGSQGLILGKPTMDKDAGVNRYPILIWADRDNAILKSTNNKKIKEENLEVQSEPRKNELFECAFSEHIHEAEKQEDLEGALFWAEAHHNIFPDHAGTRILYAQLLREKKPQKAYQLLQHLDFPYEPSDHGYTSGCLNYCVTFAKAGKRFDEALEYALKIPTDNDEGKHAFNYSMEALLKECQQIRDNDSLSDEEKATIREVHLRAATILHTRDPESVKHMINIAAGFCLADENIEGAKWYRRALAMPGFPPHELANTVRNLCMAQLQCPGMPLEDYDVFGLEGQVANCYHKRFNPKITQVTDVESHRVQGILKFRDNDMEVMQYRIPADPNDPNHFSAEFLALVTP